MEQELVLKLLKYVHHFYPVGLPHLRENYSGHKELQTILEKKINQIIDGEITSWSALINDIASSYPNVFDMGYMQFPCYMARIVKVEEAARYHFQRTLVLVISLLCPYYTLYYEDKYQFIGFVSANPQTTYRIFFTEEGENTEVFKNELCFLKQQVERHFEGHRYVHHQTLFDYSVSAGYLTTEDMSAEPKPHPFYNYLFDGYLHYENIDLSK